MPRPPSCLPPWKIMPQFLSCLPPYVPSAPTASSAPALREKTANAAAKGGYRQVGIARSRRALGALKSRGILPRDPF